MTKFDKFTCEFAESHTISDTITMLQNHKLYIAFCKYDKSITSVKGDDKKIEHIDALIKFLRLMEKEHVFCKDLRRVYFND